MLKELGPKQNPNLQQGLLPGAEEIGQGGLTFLLVLATETSACKYHWVCKALLDIEHAMAWLEYLSTSLHRLYTSMDTFGICHDGADVTGKHRRPRTCTAVLLGSDRFCCSLQAAMWCTMMAKMCACCLCFRSPTTIIKRHRQSWVSTGLATMPSKSR